MEANELNMLAQKAAEGIQPTKEQLDSMTMAELWKFTELVEKLKRVKEGTSRRMQQLDMLKNAGKKFCFKSDDGKNWTLTSHAVHRFLERCNDVDSCYDLVGLLKKDLTNPPHATENKLDLFFSRLNHREEAEYRFGSCTGLLYIVVGGHIVKTVHRNESKRWKLENC